VDSSYAFLDPSNPYCYYHNPEIYSLVQEAQSTMDPDKRKLLASQLQKRMFEEATHIFLYNQIDHYGVSKKVKGFKARPDDYMDLTEVRLEE
jgi:peptide/nickel transport system substrate-binding protein